RPRLTTPTSSARWNRSGIPIVIVTAKRVTQADLARLDGDVLKVIEKSELNQGLFISEVKQAMGKET
ncbi:MAG: hypothetical protein U1A72_04545, partial [Sulfuritalea sp.]|nr:hypothetical protein [Sulfuritalea sp.]